MMASMAWRNLWRNRRRTLVTLSSIVFGVLLAVIFTGIGDHTYSKMIDRAARLGGGHVTLQHPEYQDRPSVKRTVTETRVKVSLAERDPLTRRAVVRVTGHVMLAAGGNSQGAGLIAVDPAVEDSTTLSILDALAEGKIFAGSRDKGIILGYRLAENLGVRMGRKVVYTLTDKRGEIVTGLARVSGILRTRSPSIDRSLCLLPLDTVRDVLGYAPDEGTLVAVFLSDNRASEQVASRLRARLDAQRTTALHWRQTQPELAGFISMKVNGTLIFELIIAMLIAAGIFNTLFVSVMERLREFGIMLAIGFSPGRLFRLVLWESLWVGLAGLVLSAVVTIGPYLYFARRGIDFSAMIGDKGAEVAGVGMEPSVYVGIYPENVVLVAVAVLAATLASGLYPAWRAGRLEPVDCIKLV
jgi:ABC-type lipoprotein release transport system permease subunit